MEGNKIIKIIYFSSYDYLINGEKILKISGDLHIEYSFQNKGKKKERKEVICVKMAQISLFCELNNIIYDLANKECDFLYIFNGLNNVIYLLNIIIIIIIIIIIL